MHLKTTTTTSSDKNTTTMASINDDDTNGNSGGGGGDGNRSGNSISNNNSNNNNNNSNNNSKNEDIITQQQHMMNEGEIKLKKQTLEQRKQELEKLLSEKSWLLQQIQKQETQILNGNFEYLNLNEIFTNLAQQYKQEQFKLGGLTKEETAILRRKQASKENHILNNNNNTINTANTTNITNNNNNINIRQSELSNRSSEYDNYPGGGMTDMHVDDGGGGGISGSSGGGIGSVGLSVAIQQHAAATKNALKKRTATTTTPIPPMPGVAAANYNYLLLQRQHMLQQHVEQEMLQKHIELQQHKLQYQQHVAEQQHMLQHHLQYATTLHATHQQQQMKQQQPAIQQPALQQHHYHQSQQAQQQTRTKQQQQSPQQQIDAISLYSLNSANVATLRQQHVAPQQQPIIVQCDKYYLSPTHQSYCDGGFIKSSQNIKKYISPLASPTISSSSSAALAAATATASPINSSPLAAAVAAHIQPRQQQQHFMPLQPHLQSHAHGNMSHHHAHMHQQHLQQQQQQQQQAQLDVISLAPSYVSIDTETIMQNLRWRSQSNMQTTPSINNHDTKSSSISSLNSDNNTAAGVAAQKKSKSKQWLESSLDGPVLLHTPPPLPPQAPLIDTKAADIGQALAATTSSSTRLPHTRALARERAKLSSQSMSSARHYSMSSSHKHPHNSTKLLQDDDGRRYAKLSQSTSHLNALENTIASSISPAYHLDTDLMAFKYLPPKPNKEFSTNNTTSPRPPPPPRPPPMTAEKLAAMTAPITISTNLNVAAVANAAAASLSPDIRIESPKNMTIVQQATFQPYKEVTKPFEMSDFYKYSTKFRQKEKNES